jgi:hypothetical protein
MVDGCQWMTWTEWFPCDCKAGDKTREMRPVDKCGRAVVFADHANCGCDENEQEIGMLNTAILW